MKPGTIFEIGLDDKGFGYVQYLFKHPEYGDAILVSPRTFSGRKNSFDDVFDQTGYITFYPLGRAARTKLVHEVGMAEIALDATADMPLRRAGARVGRTISSWIITENGADRVTRTLDEKERTYPIASIWNHALLKDRILTHWSPSEGESD